MLRCVKNDAISLIIFCRYEKTSYLCLRKLKCLGRNISKLHIRGTSVPSIYKKPHKPFSQMI